MSEHTPTPWMVDDDMIITQVDAIPDDIICERTNEMPIKHSNWEANAAFIVKAVNNHDALVKALKESRAALVALMDAVQAGQKMNGREYVGLGIQVNDAIGRAWNVLASVSGVKEP